MLRGALPCTSEIECGSKACLLCLVGIRGVELLPGANVASDAELEAWVIQNVDTGYHPVGTCRMSASPADGVVDGTCMPHPPGLVYGTFS